MRHANGIAPRRRAGFTLIELLVALVLFGIVSGVILKMVRSQQRFYRGATEIIDVRSQLRQAAAVLPLDLRSVSTVSTALPAGSPYQASVLGSDITYMDGKEIRFRSTIGSAVACDVTGSVVTVVPQTLANGNVLTSWHTPPAINDTAFVFDPGAASGAGDDQWRPYLISQIATSTAACAGSPFLTAGDAGSAKWRFTMTPVSTSPALAGSNIGSGTVMRFTRSVAYGLYDSGGKWYLGYKTMVTSEAGGIYTSTGAMNAQWEPIAGPYQPVTTAGTSNGLALTYYDSTNTVTTAADRVARVDVILRGAGDSEKKNAASATSQTNNDFFRDSLQLSIAIRNRA